MCVLGLLLRGAASASLSYLQTDLTSIATEHILSDRRPGRPRSLVTAPVSDYNYGAVRSSLGSSYSVQSVDALRPLSPPVMTL